MKTGKYFVILLILVSIIVALSFENKTEEEVCYPTVNGSDDTEFGIYTFDVHMIYLSVENMYSINLDRVMGYDIVNDVIRINERKKSNNF